MKRALCKHFFLYILFAHKLFSQDTFSIVFYHGGSSAIPDYAEHAFKQACFFNPLASVLIITNEISSQKILSWHLPKNIKICVLDGNRYKKYQNSELFFKKKSASVASNLDWYCYQRYFDLLYIASRYQLKNIYFLEYDNLIYCDFSELTKLVSSEYEIGMTPISEEMIICGISFFRNKEVLSEFCNYINSKWDLKLVDMAFYPIFKSDSSLLKYLPVITTCDKMSQLGGDGLYENYDSNIDSLESIFDPAPYGQYLCGAFGTDPGFVNDYAVYNIAKMNILWMFDKKKRKIPVVFDNEKNKFFRINNLHVHSKKLRSYVSYD